MTKKDGTLVSENWEIQNAKQGSNCHENKHSFLLAFKPLFKFKDDMVGLFVKEKVLIIVAVYYLCVSAHDFGENSLFIAMEAGAPFLLVKMSGKLYRHCMCWIWSRWRRCLYIALSLSVSACSCVRTIASKVPFVLSMYGELLPVQVNSYTTFHFLNGGVLSLVLVKKHNFVVLCFIRMSTSIRVDETSTKLILKFLKGTVEPHFVRS